MASPIIKVVQIGKDSRTPFNEDNRKEFAATGIMTCKDSVSTVQVVNSGVGPSAVVPTSSHQFYNKLCNFKGTDSCKIQFPYSGSNAIYTIKASSFKGDCPHGPPKDSRKDWAVFELNQKVTGVNPYGIPDIGKLLAHEGAHVLTVSSGSENFVRNGKMPFHTEVCTIRDRFYHATIPLQTDCNTGGGSSGAGQIVDFNNRNTLAAIHLDGRTNRPPGTPYNKFDNFNTSQPLEGEFLAAIHQALGNRP